MRKKIFYPIIVYNFFTCIEKNFISTIHYILVITVAILAQELYTWLSVYCSVIAAIAIMATSAYSHCFVFMKILGDLKAWGTVEKDCSKPYYRHLTDDNFVPSFSRFITRPSNILITLLRDAANSCDTVPRTITNTTSHEIDNLCYFPDDLLCSVWDSIWKKGWCNKKHRAILLNQLETEGYM
jgi:hypothetical protein